MKPKTALQKLVVELSSKLPSITQEQKDYSTAKSFLKWGVVSRNKIYCLECAHNWKPTKIPTVPKCPNCNSKLKMYGENKVHFTETEYFSVITTKENFQVVRMISSRKFMKKNETPTYSHSEVMQHWIDEKGNVTSMAKGRQYMSQYYDQWSYGTEMTVQSKDFNRHNLYFLSPFKVFPKKKVLPIIKRNGFKGNFHNLTPHELFSEIIKEPIAETLLKTNQIEYLTYFVNKSKTEIKEHWNSLKLCIKNDYKVKDFSFWKDYIDLLKYFNKDILNAKYVCPTDLQKAHDKLVAKKRKIQLKMKLSEMKKELKKHQKKYTKSKKAFFGLSFSDGKITIKVLESVSEFLEEGTLMNHCVFTNEYFNKKDSLILSASIGDKKLETIEVSLETLKIIQSRGVGNKATEYNGKIIDLVTKNLPKIKQITLKTAV